MNRWYWGAVLCAACFAVSWFMPAYITKEWGAVWPWEIKRGWNNVDADGHPTHDDRGNQIRPNPVRKVALVVFALGGGAMIVAGYLQNSRREEQLADTSPTADKPSPPHPQASP